MVCDWMHWNEHIADQKCKAKVCWITHQWYAHHTTYKWLFSSFLKSFRHFSYILSTHTFPMYLLEFNLNLHIQCDLLSKIRVISLLDFCADWSWIVWLNTSCSEPVGVFLNRTHCSLCPQLQVQCAVMQPLQESLQQPSPLSILCCKKSMIFKISPSHN